MTHIAREHDVSLRNLIDANPQIRDPNKINPGQQINIPGANDNTPAPDKPTTRTEESTGPRRGRDPMPKGGERFEQGGLSNSSRIAHLNHQLEQPTLRSGSNGEQVTNMQTRLEELGYNTGGVDGAFGPRTKSAVQSFQRMNNLSPDGVVGPKTWASLNSPDAARRPEGGDVPQLDRYEPGSQEQIQLFEEAARRIGVPESWASSSSLHNILRRESDGIVGRPNYTYGSRANDPSQWGGIHDELKNGNITARSSATGLGQLLLSNVERHYPSGTAGIGDPVEEAAGMLSYINERYGSPERAWQLYGVNHEGY